MTCSPTLICPSLGESMLPSIYPGLWKIRLDNLQSKQTVSTLLTMTRDDDPLYLPDPRPPTPGPQPRPPPIPPQPPVPTPPPSPHYSVSRNNNVSQESGTSPTKPHVFPHPPRPPTPGPNRPGPVGPRPDVPTPPPSPRRHPDATTTQFFRKTARRVFNNDMALIIQDREGDNHLQHRAKQPRKSLPRQAISRKGTMKPPTLVTLNKTKGYAFRIERQPEMSRSYASDVVTRSSNQVQEPEGPSLLRCTRPIRSVMVILAARFLSSHGSLKTTSNL